MKQILRGLACSPVLICVVALVLRCGFLLDQANKIPAEALASVPFQNEVGNIAAAVASGHGFCCLFGQATGPTAWLAPVYPLLLAAIFKIFGSFTTRAFFAAAGMNCVFSAMVGVPIYYAGNRIGGRAVGTAAAWIWAFFPSGILMPFEWIWDTSLSALLAALLLWASLEFAKRLTIRTVSLYGMLWGVALLTNPSLGILLPLLLGWIVYKQSASRKLVANSALISLAIAAVCCVPWTVRNVVQFHRLIPLRSNFAFELWLGNNEVFDEHSRGLNRITRFEQVRRYAQLGENAFLDEKRQQVAAFLRTHPMLALRLEGRRIVATWMGTEDPWRDFQRTPSALVRFLFVWNGITLVGMIVGLVRLARSRSGYLFPVAVFPLVFPVIYYVTHTSLRYRHPCDPILALLLAVALFGVSDALPRTHASAGAED